MVEAVIVYPGSNREGDIARALRVAHDRAPHLVWHAERELPPNTDLVVLPGGFAYGDYLRWRGYRRPLADHGCRAVACGARRSRSRRVQRFPRCWSRAGFCQAC